MLERETDTISAFLAGRMDRRELLSRLGAFGLTATSAGVLFNRLASQAQAADFDWKRHQGKSIKLLLNKHPYTDAMIANLENFRNLTGIHVSYDIFSENVYFEELTAALSLHSNEYDAFMTGAYMTWTYGPAGWVKDHNEWLEDPTKTNPHFNWEDMLPGVRRSCAWNGVPGAPLGSEDAKQWCIPWGYEQNNLTYNAEMFERVGVQPPTNLDEMIDAAAAVQAGNEGVYGIGVRGTRSWATIHPGFLSAYANFGEKDLELVDGKLSAAMNTDESRAFHHKWVEMIRQSGAPDWSSQTWYKVGADLGAGRSAMIYDADILGYFANGSDNAMAGELRYAPFAANPAASAPTPNIWIWSLAMSAFSRDPDATWYFMQWATGFEHSLFGASKKDFVNPVRQSVWDSDLFREKLRHNYPGYAEMHDVSAPGASIKFTPQPLFFDLTTEWAATLQRMVAGKVPVDEGLDELAESMNTQLAAAGLR
ncbi:ABC transporter substrate-binding protein [Roseibium sediminis]|uniref:ABC transporter substrate-binding protein n=1 Tax=Roseibium sediminis TaxID=1775174 RepID=UPI00123CEB95|nr:extracellular solute-binding protein [Roseibium sediminis]